MAKTYMQIMSDPLEANIVDPKSYRAVSGKNRPSSTGNISKFKGDAYAANVSGECVYCGSEPADLNMGINTCDDHRKNITSKYANYDNYDNKTRREGFIIP